MLVISGRTCPREKLTVCVSFLSPNKICDGNFLNFSLTFSLSTKGKVKGFPLARNSLISLDTRRRKILSTGNRLPWVKRLNLVMGNGSSQLWCLLRMTNKWICHACHGADRLTGIHFQQNRIGMAHWFSWSVQRLSEVLPRILRVSLDVVDIPVAPILFHANNNLQLLFLNPNAPTVWWNWIFECLNERGIEDIE